MAWNKRAQCVSILTLRAFTLPPLVVPALHHGLSHHSLR